MNIGTLIAFAARRVLDDAPERLGVRLSPISLTGAEMTKAIQEARKALGPKVYLVGSAPEAGATEIDDRAYVAPDHRAAERATHWRNEVDVRGGEHLVYVSVERHAKASGLTDCLEPLREDDLRAAFVDWARGAKGGLPEAVVEALRDSDLLARVRLSALCEFATLVASRGAKGGAAWAAVGEALPVLNLAKDSKLGKDDTADRLRANQQLVRTLEAGESRRRAAGGPLAAVEVELTKALASPTREGRAAGLAAIDLGALKSSAFVKEKVPRARTSSPGPANAPNAAGKKPAKGPAKEPEKTTSGRGRRTSLPPEAPHEVDSPAAALVEGSAAPPADVVETPSSSPASSPVHPPTAEQSQTTFQTPPSQSSTPSQPPRSVARGMRYHGAVLPKGLSTLLARLLAGEGDPVEIALRGADRTALGGLPKTASIATARAERTRERLGEAFAAWASARRALLDEACRGREGAAAQDLVTRGLASLLEDPAFVEMLTRHVEASCALYAAAEGVDTKTMREVLLLDTAAVRGTDGRTAVRVIGPTHLLALGQALVARRALEAARDLPDASRRIVARALLNAPPAPAAMPDESGDLPIGRGEAGLLIFERVPELVSRAASREAARAVVSRYLALSPHASLGMRVALDGEGDLAALLDGVALAALDADPSPEWVEVLCARPLEYEDRSVTARALEQGRLRFGAVEAAGATVAHVVLRLGRPSDYVEDEEAAAPARISMPPPVDGARTAFELRPRGLRVRTSVVGAPELESVEALLARSAGRLPQRAFIADVAARALRAELEAAVPTESAWLGVVAPSLGRRAPSPWHLLAYEEVGPGASCAVIARDLRPATRALQDSLARFGIREVRARALTTFAERLATAGRSAFVPLRAPAAHLVARGLLASEVRKALGGTDTTLVAALQGTALETLIGERDATADDVIVLGTRPEDDGLRAVIGYATVAEAPDLDVSKPAFGGTIARRIGLLADALHLAAGERADAIAARESILWSLWSALAAEDDGQIHLRGALTSWRGALAGGVEALVLTLPEPLGGKERSGKAGRAKVTARPITLDRLNALLLGGQ